MRFIRLAAIALTILFAIPAARPAFAGFTWCEAEPHVKAPVDGRVVAVNVWVGVPQEYRSDLAGVSLNQQQVTATVVDVERGPSGTAATIRIDATIHSSTGRPFPVRLRLAVPSLDATSDYVYGSNDTPLANQVRVLIPNRGGQKDDDDHHGEKPDADHGHSGRR